MFVILFFAFKDENCDYKILNTFFFPVIIIIKYPRFSEDCRKVCFAWKVESKLFTGLHNIHLNMKNELEKHDIIIIEYIKYSC